MRDPVRIGTRDAHAEHAAERMRDDIGFRDLQMIEQCDGVARQGVEMQLAERLGGFAEADLVRHHHAVAGVIQRLDLRRPVARRKIAAVQKHHGAAVRLRGCNVHIGHSHLLAVVVERQQADRVGIGKTFKADTVRLARFRPRGRGRYRRQGEEGGGRDYEENSSHRILQKKQNRLRSLLTQRAAD